MARASATRFFMPPLRSAACNFLSRKAYERQRLFDALIYIVLFHVGMFPEDKSHVFSNGQGIKSAPP